MDEEKNDIEEQMKFTQMLKELAETQTTLAKIDAQLAITKGKDQIGGVINKTKDNLEQKAKALGANMKEIEEKYVSSRDEKKKILKQYKESLEKVNQKYDGLLQDILEQISKAQEKEQKAMFAQKRKQRRLNISKKDFEKESQKLRNEIIKATKENNIDLVKQKINELDELGATHESTKLGQEYAGLQTEREELRKAIEGYEQEYEDKLNEREQKIKDLTDEKENNKLTVVQKQNIFQKLVGAVFSRFNGTKKFAKTSIEPLMQKIDSIEKNELPKIKESIDNKREEFAQKVQSNNEKIAENINKKVKEYKDRASQTMQKIDTLRKDVINFAVETGMSVKDAEEMFTKKTVDYVVNAKDKLVDKKDEVVHGVVDTAKSVVQFGKDVKEKGKSTYRDIIQKGQNAKMNLIDSMAKMLKEKQNELDVKKQKMAEQPDKSSVEPRE